MVEEANHIPVSIIIVYHVTIYMRTISAQQATFEINSETKVDGLGVKTEIAAKKSTRTVMDMTAR